MKKSWQGDNLERSSGLANEITVGSKTPLPRLPGSHFEVFSMPYAPMTYKPVTSKDHPALWNKLRIPCAPVKTLEDGYEYAKVLLQVLEGIPDGVGLAMNQLGVNIAVAVVNVIKPVYLINPEIIALNDQISYKEGCLSYPGKFKYTKRYQTVQIKSMQYEGSVIFSGRKDGMPYDDWKRRTLEAICVQHEIDHLQGRTFLERSEESEPVTSIKTGRNEPCPCGSGKKYKRCCFE